jgi:hypothetical protein
MRPWTWAETAGVVVGAAIALAAAIFISIKLWNRRAWPRERLLRSRSDGTRIT